MFGIAMLANIDRILYGILPTCGFSFIPYYLWEDPSTSIWGDGADVWRVLGAGNSFIQCVELIMTCFVLQTTHC